MSVTGEHSSHVSVSSHISEENLSIEDVNVVVRDVMKTEEANRRISLSSRQISRSVNSGSSSEDAVVEALKTPVPFLSVFDLLRLFSIGQRRRPGLAIRSRVFEKNSCNHLD